MSGQQAFQLSFTGNGQEYFRIWIVNMFLTIITLGIYSPWAKVRTNRYFYRHTWLDNASFDYHGNPLAILKGRAIAVLLFAAFAITSEFNLWVSLAILAMIVAAMPWLLVKSFRFKLHNTSYRGLRFAFHGTALGVFINLMLLPFLSLLPLGLLWPFAHQGMVKYIRSHCAFGKTPFKFEAGLGSLFGTYLSTFLGYLCLPFFIMVIYFLMGATFGITFTSLKESTFAALTSSVFIIVLAPIVIFFPIFLLFYLRCYFLCGIQNVIWNSTHLGEFRFSSELNRIDMAKIVMANAIKTVFTLGLYYPFAQIKLLQYRLNHTTLLADDGLDNFVAVVEGEVAAAGDEIVDLFDFDISL